MLSEYAGLMKSEFACLTNLKELKADGNSITELSGISSIEGLVSLSVANNKIKSLDLGRTKWYVVTESQRLPPLTD